MKHSDCVAVVDALSMYFSRRHSISPLIRRLVALSILWSACTVVRAGELEARFDNPPAEARPWVIWYWQGGAVAAEGITADLEAMAENGIGGAYLMPLLESGEAPMVKPPVETLSPEFWRMVRHAAQEADRLGLELGMHAGAGFSLAGGPWIEPARSMQKVVWTTARVAGGDSVEVGLEQPETIAGFYRDIAILAFPTSEGGLQALPLPIVTTSLEGDFQRLADGTNNEPLRSEEPCSILFSYDEPVTVRSLRVRPHGNNFQALRLRVEVSSDGVNFRAVKRLVAPRHGWKDDGNPVTYALPTTTGQTFRFVFDPEGSEPGSEDLDWAKWRPAFKVRSLELSPVSRLEGFEGKSGLTWRIAAATSEDEVEGAIDPEAIVDLSAHCDAQGRLRWNAPRGKWTILRMGHTSTGATNYNGGAGKGLEVDKLNGEAVAYQFDQWFGEARRQIGPELAARVLKVFHNDSWETGSQNWTPLMPQAFEARNGYDLRLWLPVLAGFVMRDAEDSERVLHDFRETIGDLLASEYFGTLADLAHAEGAVVSAEATAPTMLGDGLRHYADVDIPMGEFWLRSPTHDKPNDLVEAVSGAHLYGKNIVQAEAFTELRLQWDEHPGMLKALGDRHYALGINRFVYHVFMHNPWTDRAPGMSLNGVGLFFQRDQTWWGPGKAWVDYAARCQALLQAGRPVVDVAVFTGEEMPRRAVLPDRLVDVLPGMFGEAVVAREQSRLANVGLPQRESPRGVKSSANSTDASDMLDPLHGYKYDSINLDAIYRLGKIENRRLVLPGGARYGVLVVPGARRMDPQGGQLSRELKAKLGEWENEGLPIVHRGFADSDFSGLGLTPDFRATEAATGGRANGIAWTHRATEEGELYFVSNQRETHRDLILSLRAEAGVVEFWDAVTAERVQAATFVVSKGRTELPLSLPSNGSIFVLLRPIGAQSPLPPSPLSLANTPRLVPVQRLDRDWKAFFPGRTEPVVYERVFASWSEHDDPAVKNFSGTANYRREFEWIPSVTDGNRVWLDLGRVVNIAEVFVNGMNAGTVWTDPCRLEISRWLRPGINELRIEVTNTWANRLTGDQVLPPEERSTWTNAPFRLEGRPLLSAGLFGPVVFYTEVPGHAPSTPVLPIPESIVANARAVPPGEMEKVYEAAKTPFKYGIVLAGDEGELLDCPNVFRHGDRWYMMFVANKDKVGYQTCLAESDDLLNWRRLDTILSFPPSGWDRWQGDGGVALMDTEWGGSAQLGIFEGRYWMSYIGGAQPGYETDPLSAGLASTVDPTSPAPWQRFEGNPILSPNQPHTRPFEAKTVYKTHIVHDQAESLGWPFVMYYNGKEEGGGGREAIGLAVSRDLRTWRRMGENWLLFNTGELPWAITGDPQIVKMGDLWVMFYFGAFWKPNAFDTFAASYDMVNWTKWDGPHLIEPSEPWDKQFAHKPWLLEYAGVVYHFYCAVGDQGRVIALATSKNLATAPSAP